MFSRAKLRESEPVAPLRGDWRIHADFAQRLIGIARKLYINEPFGMDLPNTAYALDSTTAQECAAN
jgi:hypothetical protein